MNISFIGGDKRNLILSNLMESEGYEVFRSGLGEDGEDYEKCINSSKYIVMPIPYSVDLKTLNLKMSSENLPLEFLEKNLHNKVIFGGKFSNEQRKKLEQNDNTVIDFMEFKNLTEKNVIPTVEGIIKLIIENTDYTIEKSNIAIIGFGRIGKRAASILKCMGASLYCFDINKVEVANIRLCGYNVIDNLCEKNNFDIIINTVPSRVVGEDEFFYIDKKTLIIDVASMPGGIDYKYASDNGYKVIHELGIPGKVAPLSAAKYMKEIIMKYII